MGHFFCLESLGVWGRFAIFAVRIGGARSMTVRNQHQHFIFHDFEAHKRAVILCGLGT